MKAQLLYRLLKEHVSVGADLNWLLMEAKRILRSEGIKRRGNQK
jgi:hypothetical protein